MPSLLARLASKVKSAVKKRKQAEKDRKKAEKHLRKMEAKMASARQAVFNLRDEEEALRNKVYDARDAYEAAGGTDDMGSSHETHVSSSSG